MTGAFNFASVPRIIFGNGKISALPGLIKQYGGSAILVTGKKSFIESLAGARLLSDLEKHRIRVSHIIVGSEPSPETVDQAVFALRFIKPDIVVSIGGGSVLDAGKAISAMIPVTGPVADYLEGIGNREHPGIKIPFIAVPTTSGTGSEATKNAVISRTGKNGFKRSLRHDKLVPDIALIDPELTAGCPPDITAASGMDCFTQLTEAFLSVKAISYTDALAVEGLKAVRDSLLPAYRNGDDINARAGMSFAALTSGICLANAGLGVIHGFASSVGGYYDIPHGLICGTLMGQANDVTVRALRQGRGDQAALRKYAFLGRLFCGDENVSDEVHTERFISYLHHLTSELGLPGLKRMGVKEEDIRDICLQTECKNNPVRLEQDELIELLTRRLE